MRTHVLAFTHTRIPVISLVASHARAVDAGLLPGAEANHLAVLRVAHCGVGGDATKRQTAMVEMRYTTRIKGPLGKSTT